MNASMTDKIIKARHYVTINLIGCHLMLIFKAIETSNIVNSGSGSLFGEVTKML